MIGRKVSKYEIESKLGQGGMGVVYKARDLTLPRHVAIKLLPPFMSAEGDARTRFEDEAKTTASLHHPNLADIYETGETEDGQLYIVMPLYEGHTLQDLIDEGPIPLERALDLFTQIASGLAKAHEKGVVHRDIKPDNVFVTDDGFVKILDFGLARFAHSTRRTATGVTVGTVRYMSPEQARGDEAGPASDVFALGAILYQLVSGQHPFQAEHNQAILYKLMSEDPPPITKSGVPDYVLRVIDGALEKDPAQRIADAGELLDVLKGGATKPQPASSSAPSWPRWALFAAMVLVVVAGLTYKITRGPGTGGPEDFASAPSAEAIQGALVVFPFAVRGSEEADYLGEGMVDLLSVGLNDVEGIRPVNPRAVYQAMKRHAGEASSDSLLDVAKSLRASMYVDGNVIEAGGRYQVNANLYDADGELMVVATARVDSEGQLFDLAEEIARQMIVAYAGEGTSGPRKLDTSLPALKAFLRGERQTRHGDFLDAMASYREAVAQDSLFAMGWSRLALISGYTQNSAEGLRAGERALAMVDRLPESERLKVLATIHFDHGRFAEAREVAKALIDSHPHDPDAWFIYGDVMFHSWALTGGDCSEGFRAIARAEEMGMPRTDYGYLFHLRASGMCGDWEFYETVLDELIALQPEGDFSNWVRAEIGAQRNDAAMWEQGLKGLDTDPNWILLAASQTFGTFFLKLEESRQVSTLLTSSRRSPSLRAQGHVIMACVDMARGRLRSAAEQMALAAENDPVYAAEYTAMLAMCPVRSDEQTLRSALATVESTNLDNYESDPGLDSWCDPHAGIHEEILATARGALQFHLGNLDAVEAEIRNLEGREGEAAVTDAARGLAEGLRAELALAGGDTTTALQILESTWIATGWEMTYMSGYLSRARERFLTARVYAARGDVENAMRWYRTAGRHSGYDMIYFGPAYFDAATLLERTGRFSEAASYYARFIELWDGCDEALAPRVADARQRLTALQSQ